MQLHIQAWGDLHASMWKMDVGSPPIRSRRFVVCREIDKWQGWVWRRLDGRVPGFDHGPILRWWDFRSSTVPRNCIVLCYITQLSCTTCNTTHSFHPTIPHIYLTIDLSWNPMLHVPTGQREACFGCCMWPAVLFALLLCMALPLAVALLWHGSAFLCSPEPGFSSLQLVRREVYFGKVLLGTRW